MIETVPLDCVCHISCTPHSHIKYCFINVFQKLEKQSGKLALGNCFFKFGQGSAGAQCNALTGCRFHSVPVGTHFTEGGLGSGL